MAATQNGMIFFPLLDWLDWLFWGARGRSGLFLFCWPLLFINFYLVQAPDPRLQIKEGADQIICCRALSVGLGKANAESTNVKANYSVMFDDGLWRYNYQIKTDAK